MNLDAPERLDRLIDEALASYASEKPRHGFESRVLARVGTRAGSLPPVTGLQLPVWAWTLAGALAGFLAGLFFALAGPAREALAAAAAGPSPLGQVCAWLRETEWSTAIRESALLYPAVEGTHLLSLAVMLGPALMLDVRLLGWLWTADPVTKVERKFLPITFTGFAVVIITGAMLFLSDPVRCYSSNYFWAKMGLILLAGLNAIVFHTTVDRRRAEWDTVLPPPPGARFAGLMGVILWTAVIFAGRYMAYSFSRL